MENGGWGKEEKEGRDCGTYSLPVLLSYHIETAAVSNKDDGSHICEE